MSSDDGVKVRSMALIGEVLVVSIPPGEKIFDTTEIPEKLLGVVFDGHPVINGQTCYLSTNDYEQAKAAAMQLGTYQDSTPYTQNPN